ncbi:MAG: hypothetical protein ACYS5V_02955 [Planctomycetota bacterium]|jgi:hypothetical protein
MPPASFPFPRVWLPRLWLPAVGKWRFLPVEACCVANCLHCTFLAGRPETWVADLGAGGWVDGSCGSCDTIAGQYTLTRYDYTGALGCYWRYLSTICSQEFSVVLSLRPWLGGGSPPWWFQLDIDLGGGFNHSYATYKSATTSNTDCWDLGGADSTDKITLTKDTENHSGGLCSSTLPATVDVWVP